MAGLVCGKPLPQIDCIWYRGICLWNHDSLFFRFGAGAYHWEKTLQLAITIDFNKAGILDEAEREAMNTLRENEERLFIKSDYPGLRRIEAVFNRLVKASGLDNIALEVRVIDDPSRLSPKKYPLLISWVKNLS